MDCLGDLRNENSRSVATGKMTFSASTKVLGWNRWTSETALRWPQCKLHELCDKNKNASSRAGPEPSLRDRPDRAPVILVQSLRVLARCFDAHSSTLAVIAAARPLLVLGLSTGERPVWYAGDPNKLGLTRWLPTQMKKKKKEAVGMPFLTKQSDNC